jgi:uncharacterized protein YeaO (DUF488 family)
MLLTRRDNGDDKEDNKDDRLTTLDLENRNAIDSAVERFAQDAIDGASSPSVVLSSDQDGAVDGNIMETPEDEVAVAGTSATGSLTSSSQEVCKQKDVVLDGTLATASLKDEGFVKRESHEDGSATEADEAAATVKGGAEQSNTEKPGRINLFSAQHHPGAVCSTYELQQRLERLENLVPSIERKLDREINVQMIAQQERGRMMRARWTTLDSMDVDVQQLKAERAHFKTQLVDLQSKLLVLETQITTATIAWEMTHKSNTAQLSSWKNDMATRREVRYCVEKVKEDFREFSEKVNEDMQDLSEQVSVRMGELLNRAQELVNSCVQDSMGRHIAMCVEAAVEKHIGRIQANAPSHNSVQADSEEPLTSTRPLAEESGYARIKSQHYKRSGNHQSNKGSGKFQTHKGSGTSHQYM